MKPVFRAFPIKGTQARTVAKVYNDKVVDRYPKVCKCHTECRVYALNTDVNACLRVTFIFIFK